MDGELFLERFDYSCLKYFLMLLIQYVMMIFTLLSGMFSDYYFL